jgi:hypothetical protein
MPSYIEHFKIVLPNNKHARFLEESAGLLRRVGLSQVGPSTETRSAAFQEVERTVNVRRSVTATKRFQ